MMYEDRHAKGQPLLAAAIKEDEVSDARTPCQVWSCCLCAAALLLTPLAGLSAAEGQAFPRPFEASRATVHEWDSPGWELESGRRLLLFPAGDLYPHYVADPHRRAFAVKLMQYDRTDIPAVGSDRINVKFGGRFGVLRSVSPQVPERAWQLNLEVGFDAQFDNENAQDNIGWDGHYGLLLTAIPARDLAVKLGMMHVSSHVGDEYMQRTGRQRIEYTRGEAVAAVSRGIGLWQAYAEAGWGYELRNPDLQKPWRIQMGAQFESKTGFWDNRLRWYGGLDLSAMEERDWRIDTAIQAGLTLRAGGRPWRLGLELHDGRPSIGEFFQATERRISLGLWLDV